MIKEQNTKGINLKDLGYPLRRNGIKHEKYNIFKQVMTGGRDWE